MFAAGPGDPFMFITISGYIDQGFVVLALWIATLISRPVFVARRFIYCSEAAGYAFHREPPNFGHKKTTSALACGFLFLADLMNHNLTIV